MRTNTRTICRNAIIISLIVMIATVFCGTETFAATKPKKLYITPTKATLTVGKTTRIKVSKVVPSKASKSVYYKSSNTKVATVSKTGLVSAKKAGTATITVTSKSSSKIKAKSTITVKANPVTTPPEEEPSNAVVVYFTHGENMETAREYFDEISKYDTEEAYDAMAGASLMVDDHNKLTGTTGVMATWIADTLKTNAVSIQVTDKFLYPHTKSETQNFVRNGEHVTGKTPDIKPITEDLSKYEVIYLGFPNWDGVPPYALYTFINQYGAALEGKKIVPFTSYDNNKYVFSDAIDVLRSKLPKTAILDSDDGLAILCRDFLDYKDQNRSFTVAWAKNVLKKAEAAEIPSVEADVDKKVKAQEMVGKIVKKADIVDYVGEYTKRSIDTNGCNKNLSSIRFFYPGFVIYAVPVNVNEAGEQESYITDPKLVTDDTYFLVRSVD